MKQDDDSCNLERILPGARLLLTHPEGGQPRPLVGIDIHRL